MVPRSTWLTQSGCRSAFSAKRPWLRRAFLRKLQTFAPSSFRTVPIPDTGQYATKNRPPTPEPEGLHFARRLPWSRRAPKPRKHLRPLATPLAPAGRPLPRPGINLLGAVSANPPCAFQSKKALAKALERRFIMLVSAIQVSHHQHGLPLPATCARLAPAASTIPAAQRSTSNS